MNITTFQLQSVDGKDIYVKKWVPQTQAQGIVQIAHGMAEHVERYNDFANFLTQNGFIVYANDHRGHGQTAETGQLGHFANKNGWKLVITDVRSLSERIKKDNPDLPLFLFGHSMGSLIVRANMMMFDKIADGAIISGTTLGGSPALVAIGKLISSVEGIFSKKSTPSKIMTGLTFKGYNTPFKPTKTKFDWLSSNHERNKNYRDDKYCGFVCSNRFFFDLLSIIKYINKKENINKIPLNMPIYLFAGTMDPVGQFGKDIPIIYNKYKNLGVKNIDIKMYKDGRHEMLNETNRQEVYSDIISWISNNMP